VGSRQTGTRKTFSDSNLRSVGIWKSPNPLDVYTLDTYVSQVTTLFVAFKIDSAIVVGNSMGGAIAAAFAGRYPKKIKALVLEDANYSFVSMNGDMSSALSTMMEHINDPGFKSYLKSALDIALPAFNGVDSSIVNHFAPAFDSLHIKALFKANGDFKYDIVPDILDKGLQSNPFPVVVLWGMQDKLIPIQGAENILSRIPAAHAVLIDSCGHCSHLERPDIFTHTIIDLFGRDGPSPCSDTLICRDPRVSSLLSIVGEYPCLKKIVDQKLLSIQHTPLNYCTFALDNLRSSNLAAFREQLTKIDTSGCTTQIKHSLNIYTAPSAK